MPVNLNRFRGEHHVVLFFYPKDNSLGCTIEACAFRDAFADLQARDAVVIGVSHDDAASHRSFAQRWNLPYILLSDRDGAAARAFGADRLWGLLPGRVTYVIDKQGIVRAAFRDALRMKAHVEAALRTLDGQRTG